MTTTEMDLRVLSYIKDRDGSSAFKLAKGFLACNGDPIFTHRRIYNSISRLAEVGDVRLVPNGRYKTGKVLLVQND